MGGPLSRLVRRRIAALRRTAPMFGGFCLGIAAALLVWTAFTFGDPRPVRRLPPGATEEIAAAIVDLLTPAQIDEIIGARR